MNNAADQTPIFCHFKRVEFIVRFYGRCEPWLRKVFVETYAKSYTPQMFTMPAFLEKISAKFQPPFLMPSIKNIPISNTLGLLTSLPKTHDTSFPFGQEDLTGAMSVAIVMGTYNGGTFLREQLDSIETQTHTNWCLWISDDGSQDDTLSILEKYTSTWTQKTLRVLEGPQNGFAANFLSLVCNPAISSDFYAYSDQDDIWHADKLKRAIAWLADIPSEIPALYCARTEIVDRAGSPLGVSQLFRRPVGFQNALTQNVGGGNTMVFNSAARSLLIEAAADINVISHDWWTYLVVSGCGGDVFYDNRPCLKYRQHDHNVIGANHTLTAPLKSVLRLMEGTFKKWNSANLRALERLNHRLTSRNKDILLLFSRARHQGLFRRIIGIYRSGVYRQTCRGNLGLVIATLFKRI